MAISVRRVGKLTFIYSNPTILISFSNDSYLLHYTSNLKKTRKLIKVVTSIYRLLLCFDWLCYYIFTFWKCDLRHVFEVCLLASLISIIFPCFKLNSLSTNLKITSNIDLMFRFIEYFSINSLATIFQVIQKHINIYLFKLNLFYIEKCYLLFLKALAKICEITYNDVVRIHG